MSTLSSDFFPPSVGVPWTDVEATEGVESLMLGMHIERFVRRDLTYQSDALNAFRGLLKRSRLYNYYGICVACDTLDPTTLTEDKINVAFASQLAWKSFDTINCNHRNRSRRGEFPSWSWTGWLGHVRFDCNRSMAVRDLRVSNLRLQAASIAIKIWAEIPDGSLRTIKSMISTSASYILPELSTFLVIEAWVGLFELTEGSSGQVYLSQSGRNYVAEFSMPVMDRDLSPHPSRVQDGIRYYQRDCMLISWDQASDGMQESCCFLILEWQDDTAYRVGICNLALMPGSRFEALQAETLGLERRRIRLG